jgi:ABC-type dipeptide/oligopeptide/nickel transport system permease subunit
VSYPDDARGAVHLDLKLQAPSAAHWFGTDEVGNDIYTRVILGARVSLQIGLIITLVAALIGVPLGIVAGYVGGTVGELIMRVTDVFLSVPALLLALAVVGALGPGIVNAMIALSLAWWPGYVRLRQAKTLALKQETYVEAARAVGTGRLRIVFVHILPNCVSPINGEGQHGHGDGDPGGGESRLHRARRPAAPSRVGRDHQPRAQLPADVVVVLRVPAPGDLPHRARLQRVARSS